MDSLKLFKNISLIVLVLLVAINGYFYYENNQNEELYSNLEKVNSDLKNENEILKENEKNISNTAREQTFNNLLEQANLFVDLVYIQKVDGYQERKSEAENVMNEEMQDRYFPSDQYNQTTMESKVINDSYYIENMDMNQKKVDVLIEIDHEIDYLESNDKDKSTTFIRVTFEKEEEQWTAIKIEDLFTDTDPVDKEKEEKI